MRIALMFLAMSLVSTVACKKSGGAGEAVAKMTELKDKMCACKDKACTDQVTAEMTKWGSERKGAEASNVSEDDQKKLVAATEELTRCMTKNMTDAAGSAAAGSAAAGSAAEGSAAAGSAAAGSAAAGSAAAGSAAAGSAAMGSDSGSGAMAAGSGSEAAAGDMAMAHRAGMCPSTVFSATTTSAVKGKAVVVTIESADKDAIAAIQKRTDELLAEKKTAAPDAGGGHNMKGAHGGAQGLCPVHLPEGATAAAKHEPKGVMVTITPKDKPDELAKDIEGRIARATDWVKTNTKAADKQNQGGVGGGKGDDGSNHSGKGDGKGHDRKKGGGKGTGGGTGTGTGTGKAG
jgi:hypothetical protein